MRLFVVVLTAFLCCLVAAVDNSNSRDGTVFIDSNIDVTTIKPNQKIHSKDSESSGDDEDGSGDVQGDSSGSGSGAVVVPKTESPTVLPTTEENVVTKVITVKAIPSSSTKSPSKTKPVHKKPSTKKAVTKKPDILTEEVREIDATTGDPVAKTTVMPTTEEDMLGGGVGGDGNVAASKQERQGLRVLTKEVIAAVIVGGICAIILIAFLVYRLRKRDEGSYVLTDSAYKDTNKLRGDTGKEAFV